ncbi:PA2169 family four-helix-bundle protein [Flavobacterium sp. FBOR7N2.3]|uniref:PA2169 family four-helix-bundle protein n=1 Tax=Flavobacterium magnesitis TaxID=3138077 RepID=A0ABV4TNB9_9FLAO
MEKYTAPLSSKLNDLLEKINDGEKGFKKAADHTDHVFLKKYFERKSKERYDFANELNIEFSMFGLHDDTSGGSIAGAVHRTWMDIKALFSVDNEEAMLEEAITGEKAALEDYNEILTQSSLPLRTRALLLKQKEAIENDLRIITKIEDLK